MKTREKHAKLVSFEFHRGSGLLIGEGRSTDADHGAYRAIGLLLIEGDSEASGPSVTVEPERPGPVGNRVSVGKNEDRRPL